MCNKSEEWRTLDGLTMIEGWARDGLTEKQIAHNMGIGETTLRRWKNQYTDIMVALKKGKDVVDYEVENALLRRCKGYTTEEVHTFCDEDGNVLKTQIVEREIPADTTACIFWLKNRRPDKWRAKPIENAGTDELGRAMEILGAVQSVIE